MINRYLFKLNLHIGKLGDSSLRHRSAILVLSVLLILVGPEIKITFGSASLAGLGISVSPPQELSVGLFLLAILTYRLIAFWASVLIESGTDLARAERKALLVFDSGWEAEEHKPSDMDQLIRQESHGMVYRWTKWQLVWEILLPNLIAATALAVYATKSVIN